MKILALEFSSPQRSVAVFSCGRDELPKSPTSDDVKKSGTRLTRPSEVVVELIESAAGHTMKPLRLVEQALAQAGWEREQIECIAIGLGPGSYTGIRAAIALAQGWSLGRQVKLLGVSSAESLAAQAHEDGLRGEVNVVIDAQRGEIYLAGYEVADLGHREVSPLRIVSPATLRPATEGRFIGPEVTRWFAQGRIVFPRAATLARLAWTRTDYLPGDRFEPIYLRETTFVKAPPPRALPAH